MVAAKIIGTVSLLVVVSIFAFVKQPNCLIETTESIHKRMDARCQTYKYWSKKVDDSNKASIDSVKQKLSKIK